ncbi:MAG TPA: patatin-like phospholipase family protein [Candidatus Onthousia faecavium]|nr:patatin-like phospholipase family protein [Candidatus Onthousia faecavium]
MKTAVVLSGGGAKGSYQLGVWKALRELHIKYDIVTGTSIGALNGVLMCEKSYFKAKEIWKRINMEYLFNELPKSNKSLDIVKLFGNKFIKNGGMDIEKIETIIEKCVNKRKFYNSDIDFGLISYNVTTRKPLILTKDNIPSNKLVDYLMASATCFPAFKMKEIDGNKYIDGGYYDNLPVELAMKLGADFLIIVDLKAPGFKKKSSKKVKHIIIKPKNSISFFLNFDEEAARLNIRFGYNDTLKAFKKLDGNKFTFKKNTLSKYYNTNKDYLFDNTEKDFLISIEKLGKIFKLDESKIYSFKSFIKNLTIKIENEKSLDQKTIKNIKSFTKRISKKTLVLFFLSHLENNKKIGKLSKIFAKEYKLAKYLQVLGVVYGK